MEFKTGNTNQPTPTGRTKSTVLFSRAEVWYSAKLDNFLIIRNRSIMVFPFGFPIQKKSLSIFDGKEEYKVSAGTKYALPRFDIVFIGLL